MHNPHWFQLVMVSFWRSHFDSTFLPQSSCKLRALIAMSGLQALPSTFYGFTFARPSTHRVALRREVAEVPATVARGSLEASDKSESNPGRKWAASSPSCFFFSFASGDCPSPSRKVDSRQMQVKPICSLNSNLTIILPWFFHDVLHSSQVLPIHSW